MFGIKVLSPLIAVVFCVSIAAGQERGAAKDALTAVKGREILEELRLREATAIKVKPEAKEWSRNLKPDGLYKNAFSKLEAGELTAKVKSSNLKGFTSTALFAELNKRAVSKGIFGSDDRQDLFRIEMQRAELIAVGADTKFFDGILKNASAVCCLVKAGQLSETGSGLMKMATSPFSESQNDTIRLCPTERFFSQPTGAFCTGFLVAPDVVMTAGHCVKPADVANARFVFGFRMTDATIAVTAFPKNDVYKGMTILGRALDSVTGEDWAMVQLDRPVANITPMKFRKDGKIANATDIYVIGFPTGLPCKVSTNAKVSLNTDAFVFNGNLDTYGGNSGSPVFNAITHEIEGILVRGGQDFQFVTNSLGGCIQSVVLADSEGNEACTRATVWASKVPVVVPTN